MPIDKTEILEDSGYRSPKFVLALVSMLLTCGMAAASAFVPALASLYPTVITGLLGSTGIYLGAHVSQRVMMGKNLGLDQEVPAIEGPVPGAPAPLTAEDCSGAVVGAVAGS